MQFNDREKAFENKFAMDQKSMFRIEARTSKLVGLWAAEKMGLVDESAENYAKEVIAANLEEPGYDDVKRKIEADFAARNIVVQSGEIQSAIEAALVEAKRQIENDPKN